MVIGVILLALSFLGVAGLVVGLHLVKRRDDQRIWEMLEDGKFEEAWKELDRQRQRWF